MKIKTATLTGTLLDYWTARAEGVAAENLEIRQVQRSDKFHCVLLHPIKRKECLVIPYSETWALCGPLIEKHGIELDRAKGGGPTWYAAIREWVGGWRFVAGAIGSTPQEAICRAVVDKAFGDEVEDVPCE